MYVALFVFITAGLYFTFVNFKNWFSSHYKIPKFFFLSWKFIIHVIGMLFIAVAIYYAENPLNIETFLIIICGLILGLINATLSTIQEEVET